MYREDLLIEDQAFQMAEFMADTSNEGLAVFKSGNLKEVVYVNSAFVHILGFETTEEYEQYMLMSESVSFYNEDFTGVLNLCSLNSSQNVNVGFIGAQGNRVVFECRVKEFTNSQIGKLMYVFATRCDKSKTVDISADAQNRFLYGISHDIRTPMNAIIGLTDMAMKNLQKIKDKSEAYVKTNEYLNKISVAGNHLLILLKDALYMAETNSDNEMIKESEVNLVELYRDTAPVLRQMAEEKQQHLSITYENVGDTYVYMDKVHFLKCILSVVSNAFKFTAENGNIEISVRQYDEADACKGRLRPLHDRKNGFGIYEIKVTDDGVGIDKEFIGDIFKEFSREYTNTESGVEGLGLGLSITSKLIEHMNGTIEVQSEKGKGSTFTMRFPFAFAGELTEQVNIKQQNLDAVDICGKRVLVVEDNEINREITVDMLECSGLVVDSACDGADALGMVQAKGMDYYDYILMDIQMPVMDGLEATRRIRMLPGGDRKPIIALSANALREDKKKAMEAGLNVHMSKPIDPNYLINTLRQFAV